MVANENIFTGLAQKAVVAANAAALNEFMGMGIEYWSALRLALSKALRSGSEHQTTLEGALAPLFG